MKLDLAVTLLACVAFLNGCNEASRPVKDTGNRTSEGNAPSQTVTANRPVQPDNTGINARDRDHKNQTPTDQKENKDDINTTAEIRKQIADAKLSVDARNIKIVTQDGHVTLRGPVKSQDEKKRIEDIAAGVASADRVKNELEVTPDKPSSK